MSSVYACPVTGDGSSLATAHRPQFTPMDAPFAVLMLDGRTDRQRALVLSSDDALTGVGVTKLLAAASLSDLRSLAATTAPSKAQRTSFGSWLTGAGYVTLTAAQVSWADCIHFAARQVNPAADLSLTFV